MEAAQRFLQFLYAELTADMKNAGLLWNQIDTAIYRLLVIETEVGMMFANAATCAASTEECLHHRRLACRAYKTAKKWMSRARFADGEAESLSHKLQHLRWALRKLGDPL